MGFHEQALAWAALGATAAKGLDRARKAWPSVAGGLPAGVAGRGAGVAPGSGPAWMRNRKAAEAWLLSPTDWYRLYSGADTG
jgi:hypothetical protein